MLFGIPYHQLLITVPLVFMAGFLDAIAGGGGLISLPAYLIAGIPPRMAIGTNKLSGGLGLLGSAGRFVKRGYIDKPILLPAIAVGLAGSAVGARLNLMVPDTVIRYLLVAILPLAAFFTLRKRDFTQTELRPILRGRQFALILLCSFFISIYDGFYGPGTGTFMLLALSQLCKLDIRVAAGCAKVIGLCACASSIAIYFVSGNVILPLALICGLSCIAGNFVGSGLVIHNGEKIVRPVVLVVLTLLFVRVLLELTGVL